jgi:excisionase family DNA binding protein
MAIGLTTKNEDTAAYETPYGSADLETLLTVHDVAQILKVPVTWVYERTRRRTRDCLPHIKMGKYVRFRLSDVAVYLEALRRG